MHSQRPTVFFFPAWYPHRGDGMFGLFVKQHAVSAAMTANLGVVFAIGEVRGGDAVYEPVFAEEEGVHTQRVYFKKSSLPLLGGPVNGYRYLRAVARGYRELEERIGTPDVNHVHILTRAGLFPYWKKKTKGTPYIITEHWSRYLPRNKGMYRGALRKFLTKKIVARAAVITTVSQNLAEAMQAHGLKHPDYRLIYNVADSRTFRPVATKAVPAKIIHISCFEERSKNLRGIVRAMKLLSERRTDFVLEMVGDGVDRPATEQLAEMLGLKDRLIRFPGLREGEDLGRRLAESQFLLIFSHYENMPVVMNEAFMCGVPVLATDVGGIREMLTPDKGVLLTPGDEQALADTLDKLLDGSRHFDPKAIRNFAETHFSRQALCLFLGDLYREVMPA